MPLVLLLLLLAGCSPAPPIATPTTAATPDLVVVNSATPGERFDVEPALPKDRPVLVEFFSLNCPPCVQFVPLLEELAQKRPDLAIRKFDIDRKHSRQIDFDSPLAQQYQIDSVPYFAVYEKGVLKSRGKLARDDVKRLMQEAEIIR